MLRDKKRQIKEKESRKQVMKESGDHAPSLFCKEYSSRRLPGIQKQFAKRLIYKNELFWGHG